MSKRVKVDKMWKKAYDFMAKPFYANPDHEIERLARLLRRVQKEAFDDGIRQGQLIGDKP